MLAAQRRDLLLVRLRTDGRLVARDLAVELGRVSLLERGWWEMVGACHVSES